MISEKQLVLLGKNICNAVSKGIRDVSKNKILGKNLKKKADGVHVKFADELGERIVKKILKNKANKEGIGEITLISEECGIQSFGRSEKNKDIVIILDPVDGSSNLRASITPGPIISTCIAITQKKDLPSIKYAFVKDIFNNQLYYAIKGKGAYLENFGRIKTSKGTRIEDSIIGFDFDTGEKKLGNMIKKLSNLLKKTKSARRLGSSALDFCKVACGEYDAFLSLTGRMGVYDIAAPKLIVEEAGGIFKIEALGLDIPKLIRNLIKTKDSRLINENRFNVICSNVICSSKNLIKI